MASAPDIPETHRAWTFDRRGPISEVLSITPLPTTQPAALKAGEALIKVAAVSLNAGTLLFFAMPHPTSHKWVPELEFAGTIVALGPPGAQRDEEGLKVGDRVVGSRNFPETLRNNGVAQEYLVSSVKLLARAPANTSLAEASGISGVGCTAIQSVQVGRVKRGDKVLITGGSSGLGTILVQVVREVVGETGLVVATCSGRNQKFVEQLGANETIDYTKHSPMHEYLLEHHSSTPFNVIFDIVNESAALFTSSPAYLTKDGSFILLGGLKIAKGLGIGGLLYWVLTATINRFRPRIIGGTPRRFLFYSATPCAVDTKKVVNLIEEGKIKPVVDSTWKFEDLKQAYEKMASQRARGKIAINLE